MTYNNSINLSNKISVFFVFLLPIGYIFSPALINISISYIVINFIINIFYEKINLNFKDKLFQCSVIFWIYICVISFFLESSNIPKSIFYIRFILLPYSVYFLLFNSISLINKIRKFYLTIVFLVSIDILIQYFYGIDILGFRADIVNGFATPIQNWSEIENIERYTGPFGYEKRAGTFILVFGLISIFLNEFNKKKTFNFFSIFSLIFFFVIIIITGDRSPLITYIIVLFLILIFEKNKKFFLFIIFSLLTVFIIFIIFSSKANFRYIKNLDNFRNYEVNQSLFRKIFHNNPWAAHNLNAMEIFKSSPFFGKGIKSFRVECKKHEDIDSSYANFSCSTHPHNILFEIISEVGLVGLTILVSILFFLIKKFSSSSSLSSRSYIFYLFIGLILPIKPSGALFSSWFGSLIWLSVAFAFLYNKNFNK